MRFNGSMLALTEAWASRASCKQRRGRAGRVRAGICYKLFSKRFEETKMPANSEPEMVRIPLEQLCLQVKAMGHDNVREFLGKVRDAEKGSPQHWETVLIESLRQSIHPH